ncbi:hypothetical protein [Kribbella antiqua]|uniref:hypothetical protein n=1 Tax=Kribbella antiqua TaxID=2512217 RepID=UPI001045F2D2|nr:hypothetical protein [Kribbella antiqua]
MSATRPLDWGDAIPTKSEIAAQYGPQATIQSLTLLARAASVEERVTDSMLAAMSDQATPYHLANRVKSPQSLARKFVKYADYYRRTKQVPEDVLRYTAAVKHPDELTRAAVRTIDRLNQQHWQMDSAHHSYVEGSRYKGLHAFLRSWGERVELQVHSAESIDVKERTTPLYEIERDVQQDPVARDAARRECIALSDQMSQPAGIDDLKELGGVEVRAISYGKKRPAQRLDLAETPTIASAAPEHIQQRVQNRENGTSR